MIVYLPLLPVCSAPRSSGRAPEGSNPVVGSSRKSNSGSPASPMATSSLRCWPPDSRFTRVRRCSLSPMTSRICSSGSG